MNDLAGLALAAGAGTRLRPLTLTRPKPLCPVDNVALLDRALRVLDGQTPHIAVNAHHHAEQIVAHVGDRAYVSVERPQVLGTAGALGRLRDWIAGRDVVVVNADAYLCAADGEPPARALDGLVAGWDRERCRLLVTAAEAPGDFVDDRGPVRYVGACLLPWRLVAGLAPEPTGLYEVLWRHEHEAGRLDLLRHDGTAIDCGTPSDYLRANLHASGGRSVVGPGARVDGTLERCVVWPGAVVTADEHLVECIRAGTCHAPVTVAAPLTGDDRSGPGGPGDPAS